MTYHLITVWDYYLETIMIQANKVKSTMDLSVRFQGITQKSTKESKWLVMPPH